MRIVSKLGRSLMGLACVAGILTAVAFAGTATGRYRLVVVLTGSMAPGMPAGSVAIQTPMKVSQVGVGDVITYRAPIADHRVVTHRVVEVIEAGDHPSVRTKGDGNGSVDNWVARLDGGWTWKTQAAVPQAGHVVQWIRLPASRMAMGVLVPLLLAGIWVRDLWRRPDRVVTA